MNIVKSENISPFDVDGTLIMHVDLKDIPVIDRVGVYDAVTKKFIFVQINRPMVRLLREASHRGDYVIVWSRGGYEWASNVIKALGLVDDVDQVMSKPLAYFDDTAVEKWLPYRVMLDSNAVYKQTTNKGKK